jgi:hypothetical protein
MGWRRATRECDVLLTLTLWAFLTFVSVRTQPPNLRFAPLIDMEIDMGFAIIGPLARRARL